MEVTRQERPLLEVPAAVSYVDEAAIQRAQPQITLDESLRGVPGVFILNPDNYAQDTRIAIRGFGARADFGIRGIRLVIDGIPATTPDGQGEVDGMDLGSAASIEVLRGPSAVFYGAASGGVILIETEDGPADPFIETRWTSGAFNLLHAQVKSGGRQGRLSYLLSGGYLETDGYRQHNETENRRLNGKLEYRIDGRQRLGLIFNVIDFPLQNDPGGLTRAEAEANPRQARDRNVRFNSGESVAQERVGLRYRNDLDTGRSLEISLHYTHRDFANRLPFQNGGQVAFTRDFYGSRFTYTHSQGRFQWAAGGDFDLQEDARENFENLDGTRGSRVLDQREEVRSAGLFAFQEVSLTEQLSFTTALRFDAVKFEVTDSLLADGDDSGSITFDEVSPMGALKWSLAEQAMLYLNVSSSFETPTTTEFDNPSGGGFNRGLESQTARNYEIGTRGSVGRGEAFLQYNAAFFFIEIEDALVPYELPEFPDREFFRNAGESTREGLEVDLQLRLRGGFSIGLDYTWSNFTYERFSIGGTDLSGRRIPGIPEHFGGLVVAYEDSSGLHARLRTQVTGSFYANDANTARIDGYQVTDFRMGYRWETGNWSVEPFFGVRNVFDEDYFANVRINAFGGRHFEPAPGRNVYGGLRIRYEIP